MTARLIYLTALLGAINLLSPQPSPASTVHSFDLKQMSQQAQFIVEATVTQAQSYWASPAGVKAIRTKVTFSPNATPLKGHVPSPFTLDFSGGKVNGVALEVTGIPEFKPGDHLILFAYDPLQPYVCATVGLTQGVIRILKDQNDNTSRVYRYWGQPINENEPFGYSSEGTTTPLTDLGRSETLEEFCKDVSELLGK
jgi:hypothetical protein